MMRPKIVIEDQDAENADKLYFNHFLTKAYQLFLAGADDYSEMERELEDESDRQNETTMIEISRLEDDNQRLKKELDELQANQSPLQKLHEDGDVLRSDLEKFKKRIDRQDKKRAQMVDANTRLAQMLEEEEAAYEQMGKEKMLLQEQVDAQDISATDVEMMNSDQEALVKSLEIATAQLHEASSQVFERERLAQDKMDALERAIQTYNSIAYNIGVIPESAPRAKNMTYELEFRNPLEHGKTWFNSQPQDLINVELRAAVKPALSQMRESLGSETLAHGSECIRLEQLLDQVNEALNDTKEDLEELYGKLENLIQQEEEKSVTTTTETSICNAQAEKLERDLAMDRNSAQNGLIQLDQRVQCVEIEYEQLQRASDVLRGELVRDVSAGLEDVIDFKVHIQSSLEALDTEAAKGDVGPTTA